VLRRADSGTPVADGCRGIGISEATFYVRKKKDASLGGPELRELRQLEDDSIVHTAHSAIRLRMTPDQVSIASRKRPISRRALSKNGDNLNIYNRSGGSFRPDSRSSRCSSSSCSDPIVLDSNKVLCIPGNASCSCAPCTS
jgi:hypothetical protein